MSEREDGARTLLSNVVDLDKSTLAIGLILVGFTLPGPLKSVSNTVIPYTPPKNFE